MLLPISDDDRTLTGRAWITVLLVLANAAVFIVLQDVGAERGAGARFTYGYSVVPREITTGADLNGLEYVTVTDDVTGETTRTPIPLADSPAPVHLTILTAMFMHGGWAHLLGNLLFLWIFGDNVEHRFGWKIFAALYLACGILATLVQVLMQPQSIIPNLGASGAISGVLGAYLALFPRNRVRVVFFVIVFSVPAFLVLGLWAVSQLVNGYGATVAAEETAGGVAYGAHVGGFVTGFVGALILGRLIPPRPPRYAAS